MIKLYDNGVYLVNGTDIVEDNGEAAAALAAKCGQAPSKEEAAKGKGMDSGDHSGAGPRCPADLRLVPERAERPASGIYHNC